MIVAKVTKIIGETDTDTGYATDVTIPASFVQKYTFLRPNLCLNQVNDFSGKGCPSIN